MLQQWDSSKPIPISCFPTSKTLTLANAVLWPELFLLALAKQHSLILPFSSTGERSQCCMADKGNCTWFHPRSKTASRTVPPCKAACWTYSPAWQQVNDITCVKTGICLRSLWNNNLHEFHPVDTVVWLFSLSCRGEVTWSVLREVALFDTGGTCNISFSPFLPFSLSLPFLHLIFFSLSSHPFWGWVEEVEQLPLHVNICEAAVAAGTK